MTVKAIVFDAYGTLYDIQSVANISDEAFPGYGERITQIWRIKQLEYTWLRSLMCRYEDFITRDSLTYTLKILGLAYNDGIFERIMDKYVDLDLYPDAKAALLSLKNYKRAILSNGSTDMLTTLVRNTGLDGILDATISIGAKGIFKPSPEAYSLIEARLDVKPSEVLFVSSNPWDAIGAKAVGLKVAWIERVTQEAMAASCRKSDLIAPLTMFRAIRMQMDELDVAPDYKVKGLAALPDILSASELAAASTAVDQWASRRHSRSDVQ